jgi:hypothetical protein
MAQVALNADLYAAKRLNIFFKTVVASLEGQCVTLTKNFMEDMTSVPNPHAARGDARYVGKALVSQGHAIKVAYSQRKRGDLICYEYGTYGHIAVQLSNGRVFEENVNMGGVASKIVDGQRVYASRIGSETESWRASKNPNVYRLKTYKEEEPIVIPTIAEIKAHFKTYLRRDPTSGEIKRFDSRPWKEMAQYVSAIQRKLLVEESAKVTKAAKDLAQCQDGGTILTPGTHKFIVK